VSTRVSLSGASAGSVKCTINIDGCSTNTYIVVNHSTANKSISINIDGNLKLETSNTATITVTASGGAILPKDGSSVEPSQIVLDGFNFSN
jgi:hypothetical protein